MSWVLGTSLAAFLDAILKFQSYESKHVLTWTFVAFSL